MWTDHKTLAKGIGKMFHLSSQLPLPRGKDATILFVHITSAWSCHFFKSGALFIDPSKIGHCNSVHFTAEKTKHRRFSDLSRMGEQVIDKGEIRIYFWMEWLSKKVLRFLDLINLELNVGVDKKFTDWC